MAISIRKFTWPLTVLLLASATGAVWAGWQSAINNKPSGDGSLKLVTSGNACLTNSRPAEGLMWYRQAALDGSMEGVYRAGLLFLNGQKSPLPAQAVLSDPAEGVRWMFWAATNMHPQACKGMARIYSEGLAVKTNLVQAYAWMRLFSALDPSAGAEALDKMATELDAQQICEAQELASQFKLQQWPPAPCKKIVQGDPRLTLNGITIGGTGALAVINRKTIGEGESADIEISSGQLTVTCVEIREQSVLVDVLGENNTRLLTFR